ncbi:MAG: DUF4377 domain-containing protein, partial [Myxococcota bacterium]
MRGCIRNDGVRRAALKAKRVGRALLARFVRRRAAVGLAALLVGCASTPKAPPKQVELTEIWVNHHLVPCKGWEGQDYCFAVAEQPNGPWTLAYDGLENFYYQWGYSYRLLVGPSQFGGIKSSGKRVFKIKRKRRPQVGTEFDFAVDPQLGQLGLRTHLTMNRGVGKILMGPAFTCSTRSLCDDIERRLETEERFVVRFAYGVAGEIQAVGVNVKRVAAVVSVEPAATSTAGITAARALTSTTGLSTTPAMTSTTSVNASRTMPAMPLPTADSVQAAAGAAKAETAASVTKAETAAHSMKADIAENSSKAEAAANAAAQVESGVSATL